MFLYQFKHSCNVLHSSYCLGVTCCITYSWRGHPGPGPQCRPYPKAELHFFQCHLQRVGHPCKSACNAASLPFCNPLSLLCGSFLPSASKPLCTHCNISVHCHIYVHNGMFSPFLFLFLVISLILTKSCKITLHPPSIIHAHCNDTLFHALLDCETSKWLQFRKTKTCNQVLYNAYNVTKQQARCTYPRKHKWPSAFTATTLYFEAAVPSSLVSWPWADADATNTPGPVMNEWDILGRTELCIDCAPWM